MDQITFNDFFNSNYSRLIQIVRNKLSTFKQLNDIFIPKDVCHDVFIKIRNAYSNGTKSQKEYYAIFYRSVMHHLIDLKKKRDKLSFLEISDLNCSTYSLDQHSNWVKVEWLNFYINQLQPRHREVLQLLIQGYRNKDIAQLLGYTENQVSDFIRTGIKGIQRMINQASLRA